MYTLTAALGANKTVEAQKHLATRRQQYIYLEVKCDILIGNTTNVKARVSRRSVLEDGSLSTSALGFTCKQLLKGVCCTKVNQEFKHSS